MKFKTMSEFEAWLRDYSEPFGNKKNFLNDAILSKEYTVSTEKEFIMDKDIIYAINRVNQDPEYYYICYSDSPNKMWWTMASKLYNRNMAIKEFNWGSMNGWASMTGAKIWILTDDLGFESFINWTDNPFEVKS